jgi:type IV pilus assembly protein PilA
MLRNREGFTLIELLIVVVIIGILAAIALPKFGQTREAAYYTTMKADLNNMRSAQEMYYQTSGTFSYADNKADLNFSPSSGVTIDDGDITLINGGQAWEAIATHAALPDGACVIGFGEDGDDDNTVWAGSASGGTPAVAVTADNAGAPVCND